MRTRIIGYTVVLIILGVLAYTRFSNRDARKTLTTQVEQAQRTEQATKQIIEDADEQVVIVRETEVVVQDARTAYQRGYEDAKRTTPPVATWADQPVPQRLRDLARERRAARERPDGSGLGD